MSCRRKQGQAMNYDIALCVGSRCPIKEKCLRYVSHVEAGKTGCDGIVSYIGSGYEFGNCNNFIGNGKEDRRNL